MSRFPGTARGRNNWHPKTSTGAAKQDSGWKVVSRLSKLPDGKMIAVAIDGISLIVCRVKNELYAYGNLCPACERSFTNGTLEGIVLVCQPGHRFDVQHAGDMYR